MPRWILVDDTDSGIRYSGPWFEDQNSQNNLGNFGVPFKSTLHGTTSNASLSYTFQGTRVLITGTLEYSNTSGPITDPSWECFVDNASVPVKSYSQAENRLLFCEQDGLSDESHTITLNAQAVDQRTFLFDYIQYLPSSSVPLDQAAISIDVPDPDMQFGTGWTTFGPGYMTSTPGSTFSFDFSGVSLTWLGFYDDSLPLTATTATYAVDGQRAIPFNLNGIAASSTGVQFNQIFFQTAQLAAGQHTIQVAYQGNSQTAPLTISNIVVLNGTLTPAIDTVSRNTAPVGLFVGGIIGALASLILVLVSVCLCISRIRRKRRARCKTDLEPSYFPPALMGSFSQEYNIPSGRESGSTSRPSAGGAPASLASTGLRNEKARFHADHSRSTRPEIGAVVQVGDTGTYFEPQRSRMELQRLPATQINSTSLLQRNGNTTLSSAPPGYLSRVVRDEDSGIRLPGNGECGSGVTVLPPEYSEA